MNALRRKKIENALSIIEEQISILELLRDEEQEYLDNMPENLQGSEKYDSTESGLQILESAIENINSEIEEIRDNTIQ